MRKFYAFLLTFVFFPMMLLQVVLGAIIHFIGKKKDLDKYAAYGKNLALAADQNLNTIWLGHPDETVSSRTGRAVKSGKPRWYIKYLLHPFVDRAARIFGDAPNHCVRSIEEDLHIEDEIWTWSK